MAVNKNKLSFRIRAYPFKSTDLFQDFPGILISVASLVLRLEYLKSRLLNIVELQSIQEIIQKIFRRPPFSQFSHNEIGFHILDRDDGIQIIASLLGVYKIHNHNLIYLHPSLIECLSLLTDITEVDQNKLHEGMEILANILVTDLANGKVSPELAFKLQKIWEDRLNEKVNYKTALSSLWSLVCCRQFIIPLSKCFNRYLNVGGER
ncbi:MAG TPA: hypothetical protein ENI49_03845 [Thermoplasmatales archaeon]|nr:hypothetical protein [Thermoplasmatales archaeon]